MLITMQQKIIYLYNNVMKNDFSFGSTRYDSWLFLYDLCFFVSSFDFWLLGNEIDRAIQQSYVNVKATKLQSDLSVKVTFTTEIIIGKEKN